MKRIKYLVMFREHPECSLNFFEIFLGQSKEIAAKGLCGLTQESMTDDELRAYITELAKSHNWREIIKITEVLESYREIPYEAVCSQS